MHIELNESTLSWQKKAREYADEYLQPYEVEAELNGGVLPPEIVAKQKARAIELGVNDYLGKPYQDMELLEAIQRLLEERGVKLS